MSSVRSTVVTILSAIIMSHSAELERLVTVLKEHHPDNVLMPLRHQLKSPVFGHKDGRWSWERFSDYAEDSLSQDQPIGILMRSLIAIDIDDRSLIPAWEERFPELQQCPKETTRNGAHYLMARTQLCDEKGITDVAGGLKEAADQQHLKIDIKTICSTGTAGVLCVAPSPNKVWVRAPSGPLPAISDNLVTELARMRQNVLGKQKLPAAPKPTAPSPPPRLPSSNEVDDTEMCRLLSLLAQHRWDAYGMWFKIGMALKGEDVAGTLGYREVFEAFSEKSASWTADAAIKWDQLPAVSRVGLGTIHMWARQDNPQGYQAYRARTMRYNLSMLSAIGGKAHYWAAKCVMCLRPGEFVSTDESKRAFYAFYDHRWHSGGDSIITEVISNELAAALRQKLDEVMEKTEEVMDSGTKSEQRAARAQRAKALSLWEDSFNTNWQDAILKQLQHRLYTDGRAFLQQLDSNTSLLGFSNGILNVTTLEFGDGRPEHMVTRSCGYDYTPDVDEQVAADIHTFLQGCFQTEEEKLFCLQSLAAALKGTNQQEVFHIWTGTGQNGKGCTATLMERTLNDMEDGYAGSIDIAYFTTVTKNSSAASPEVAALQGRRWVTCPEPENCQQLQGGKVKKISGRDNITARHLYGQTITFKPQFIIWLQANGAPVLSKADGGTRRRIRVQEWVFEFMAYPMLPTEKQIDITFKETKASSLAWRQQFMLILLANQVPIVEPPQQVLRASEAYEQTCNPMAEWVNERVEFGPEFSVKKEEWYNDYRMWAGSLGQKYLGTKQAAQAIIDMYGKKKRLQTSTSNGTKYIGFRLIPTTDEAM